MKEKYFRNTFLNNQIQQRCKVDRKQKATSGFSNQKVMSASARAAPARGTAYSWRCWGSGPNVTVPAKMARDKVPVMWAEGNLLFTEYGIDRKGTWQKGDSDDDESGKHKKGNHKAGTMTQGTHWGRGGLLPIRSEGSFPPARCQLHCWS